MSEKLLDIERKAIKKAASAGGDLADALKAIAKSKEKDNVFAMLEALAVARKACTALAGLPGIMGPLQDQLKALTKEAEGEAERMKARVIGGLDDALKAHGLKLEGRLPQLRCGPLTLELGGSGSSGIAIWYGPRVASLGSTSLEPEPAAKTIAETLAKLNTADFTDAAFMADLLASWRAAVGRAGGEPGDRAPIVAVLAEMALTRQSRKWRNQPTRSGFKEYSRVQFSHDLGRARTRTSGGYELLLTVATRDQTRNAADHLWVSGTHYAFIAFRQSE